MRGRASRGIRVACARRLIWAALLGIVSLGAYADDLARGDSAWRSRAEGERGGRPRPDPILEGIRSYEAALAARPESLEARWKLLRALHFAGDFVLEDREEQRRIFDDLRHRYPQDEAEEALHELLAARTPPPSRTAGAGVR